MLRSLSVKLNSSCTQFPQLRWFLSRASRRVSRCCAWNSSLVELSTQNDFTISVSCRRFAWRSITEGLRICSVNVRLGVALSHFGSACDTSRCWPLGRSRAFTTHSPLSFGAFERKGKAASRTTSSNLTASAVRARPLPLRRSAPSVRPACKHSFKGTIFFNRFSSYTLSGAI